MSYDASVALVMTILIVFYVGLFVLLILNYVMKSLSYYKVGKRRGVRCYGLAWVPVLGPWVLGSIADMHDRKNGMDHKWRHVLLWLNVASLLGFLLFSYVMFTFAQTSYTGQEHLEVGPDMLEIYAAIIVMALPYAALFACGYISLYKYFESCRPRSTVCFLLVGIFIPLCMPFFIFACRNWDDGVNIKKLRPAEPELARGLRRGKLKAKRNYKKSASM